MKKNTQHSRPGFSLLELVLVMAVVSLIGTVSIRLIHAMLRQQTTATKQLALENSLIRIERIFRDDVHAAQDAKIQLDSSLVLTTQQGKRIEWKRSGNLLTRLTTTVAQPSKVGAEHFDLLPELQHTFIRKTIEDVEFVEFALHRSGSKSGSKEDKDNAATDNANEAPDAVDPRFTTARYAAKILAALGRDTHWQSQRMLQDSLATDKEQSQ